jgi:hypothetical protein
MDLVQCYMDTVVQMQVSPVLDYLSPAIRDLVFEHIMHGGNPDVPLKVNADYINYLLTLSPKTFLLYSPETFPYDIRSARALGDHPPELVSPHAALLSVLRAQSLLSICIQHYLRDILRSGQRPPSLQPTECIAALKAGAERTRYQLFQRPPQLPSAPPSVPRTSTIPFKPPKNT